MEPTINNHSIQIQIYCQRNRNQCILINRAFIIIKMEYTKLSSKNEDDEYDEKADPKRKNYKKIKLQIKKSMIHDFYNDGIGISLLTKKYHLSYSTIAHILKVYKEKERIFQPKGSKKEKDMKKQLQRFTQIKQTENDNEALIVKIQQTPYVYYPFFPQWGYFST